MALEFVPIFESMQRVDEGACLIEVTDDRAGTVAGYVLAVAPDYYGRAKTLADDILAKREGKQDSPFRVHLVVYHDGARLFIDREMPNGGGKSYKVREVARRGNGAQARLAELRAQGAALADVLGFPFDDEGRTW